MRDPLSEHHITCEVCSVSIDLTVLADRRHRFEVHAAEELLVDYGWLPTTRGSYCPAHAHAARQGGA